MQVDSETVVGASVNIDEATFSIRGAEDASAPCVIKRDEKNQPADEDAEMLSGLLGMMRDLVPEDPATLLPSWCFILDLLAVLLPEGTIACTADQRMAKAFAEAGICQESLPPALLARLPEGWHAPEGYAVTYGEEPMWKLIGKKAPQSDRPWLDRRQLVILCTADDVLERA